MSSRGNPPEPAADHTVPLWTPYVQLVLPPSSAPTASGPPSSGCLENIHHSPSFTLDEKARLVFVLLGEEGEAGPDQALSTLHPAPQKDTISKQRQDNEVKGGEHAFADSTLRFDPVVHHCVPVLSC